MSMTMTIVEALAAMRTGRVTAEALVIEALQAANQHAQLNAVAELAADRALELARQRDAELAARECCGVLHGIPITIKDLFEVEGLPTRAGTKAKLPTLPPSSAVRQLENAGAIIVAKTNMHEVALGLTGENEWTGDVRNPFDEDRQSGGSSSGSAVAVAGGIGLASLGTDTGGSIRVPAAHCGVVGFKPTHGLVPLDGALPLSPTCDHAGPITRSVADARLMTEVLAGRDLSFIPVRKPRLGVPLAYLKGRVSLCMREAFDQNLEQLKDSGAEVVAMDVPDLELTAKCYSPLVRAEAAYVHRAALASAPEEFSSPVQAALAVGADLLASEYLEARALRSSVIQAIRAAFGAAQVDALVLPSTPAPALRRGESEIILETGRTAYRDAQLALTAPFSLAGVPTVSIPAGKTEGLPTGVQFVALWGFDTLALSVAQWAEKAIAAD